MIHPLYLALAFVVGASLGAYRVSTLAKRSYMDMQMDLNMQLMKRDVDRGSLYARR